jgi:hypothetical protein
VDLLRSEQWPVAETGRFPNLLMSSCEPLQHFGFIAGNVNPRDSLRENVTTDSNRVERWKLFKRQLHS